MMVFGDAKKVVEDIVKPVSKSFQSKQDTEKSTRQLESEIDKG